ncbi:alkaline phosphatase [Qipengyuania sp.]|uniref:alkaline phosphatase n=1 Tax=Qipengyuania sp. TaxID=2004515 RepID=UPI0035C830A6
MTIRLVAALLLALPLAACATDQNRPVTQLSPPARAKNVILFIGDGMGISTITAARIYEGQKRGETGEENLLSFERFPQTALVKTYNTNAQVPDSAGTASALNAGVKTSIGVINVDHSVPKGDCAAGMANPLPITAEAARQAGLNIGIVTTARLTHATPAAVYAHSPDRDWESDKDIPAAERAKGCQDIASQLLNFPFDVALGGGMGKFAGAGRLAPDDIAKGWAARTGGSFVQTASALAAAPANKPVLGLFSPSHMTYMADRTADSGEPTLTDMTAAALSRLGGKQAGYYLMVEGGRIDHAHHAGQAGYALEETVEFARAVQYALEHTDPAETLILVTADHSHVFTIAGYPRRGNPILGLVTGGGEGEGSPDQPALAADGKPYTTLGYANGPGAVKGERGVPETGLHAHQQALVPLGSETHGGEDVALYATGPGSQAVHGVMEQNVIQQVIAGALGLE